MKSSKLPFVASLLIGGLVGSAVGHWLLPVSSEASASRSGGDPIGRLVVANSGDKSPADIVAEPASIRAGIDTLDERYKIANSYRSKRRSAWELERLFEAMTAEEASAMFNKIMHTPEYSKPGGLVAPFFRAWGSVDGASALAAAKGLEGNAAKDAYKHLFPAWAISDVHAAWEAAQANQSLPRSYDWYFPVLSHLAKQEPDILLKQINEGETTVEEKEKFGFALVDAAVDAGDFTSLWGRLEGVETPELREQLEQNALRAWAAKDSEGALNYLESIVDPDKADKAMGNYLMGWVVSNRSATLDYVFENLANEAVERSMDDVFRGALLKGNRDENLALIKRLGDSGLIEMVGPSAVRALSYYQPDIATRLDDSLDATDASGPSEPKLLHASMRGPMREWVQKDFDGAYSYFNEVESVELKLKHLPVLANELYRRSDGGTLAVSLIESVPESKERTEVLEQMLQRAASMGNRASPEFIAGLEIISESRTTLSDQAEAAREKLFGPRE